MKYLLDTNILLIYLRNHPAISIIENQHRPFNLPNIPLISVVTVGEIKSLALRNGWGKRRLTALTEFLDELVIADINSEDVIERYSEIDAFSQGKLPGKPLGQSARNMGKNDLWIAATASVAGASLMTTDSDFDHLESNFLELIKIEI